MKSPICAVITYAPPKRAVGARRMVASLKRLSPDMGYVAYASLAVIGQGDEQSSRGYEPGLMLHAAREMQVDVAIWMDADAWVARPLEPLVQEVLAIPQGAILLGGGAAFEPQTDRIVYDQLNLAPGSAPAIPGIDRRLLVANLAEPRATSFLAAWHGMRWGCAVRGGADAIPAVLAWRGGLEVRDPAGYLYAPEGPPPWDYPAEPYVMHQGIT